MQRAEAHAKLARQKKDSAKSSEAHAKFVSM